ncbi:MAG: MscL family protein [Candidatus Pacearchaeota archaeon]
MKILKEFKDFLNEYKIVPLAIAFIIGVASTNLIQSIVNNLIMPIITPFIPNGEWQNAKAIIGPFVISWGALLSAIINFIIIALFLFLIVKIFLKKEIKN